MHQVVALNLPQAREGKLYLEDCGQRVLHVWPDLSQKDTEAPSELDAELAKLVGGLDGYDNIVLHAKTV